MIISVHQVALLSSKVDLAETELRSMRTQSSWMAPDLSDVQHLADQLENQKVGQNFFFPEQYPVRR